MSDRRRLQMVWLICPHIGNVSLRGLIGSSGGRGRASMLEGDEGPEMEELVSPSTLSRTKLQN